MMESYHGYVRSPLDAIILFEACRIGMLPRVQRRLSEKERRSIQPGSVFVWDEREAGMRRWTDGKSWSASRVSGAFLTYREMEGRRYEDDVAEKPADTTSNPRSAPNNETLPRSQSPESKPDVKREGSSSPSSSSTNGSSNITAVPWTPQDGYRYKADGLMKQSYSVTTTTNLKLHLISYFTRAQLLSGSEMLPVPSLDAALSSVVIPKGLYPDHNPLDFPDYPNDGYSRNPFIHNPHAAQLQPQIQPQLGAQLQPQMQQLQHPLQHHHHPSLQHSPHHPQIHPQMPHPSTVAPSHPQGHPVVAAPSYQPQVIHNQDQIFYDYATQSYVTAPAHQVSHVMTSAPPPPLPPPPPPPPPPPSATPMAVPQYSQTPYGTAVQGYPQDVYVHPAQPVYGVSHPTHPTPAVSAPPPQSVAAPPLAIAPSAPQTLAPPNYYTPPPLQPAEPAKLRPIHTSPLPHPATTAQPQNASVSAQTPVLLPTPPPTTSGSNTTSSPESARPNGSAAIPLPVPSSQDSRSLTNSPPAGTSPPGVGSLPRPNTSVAVATSEDARAISILDKRFNI